MNTPDVHLKLWSELRIERLSAWDIYPVLQLMRMCRPALGEDSIQYRIMHHWSQFLVAWDGNRLLGFIRFSRTTLPDVAWGDVLWVESTSRNGGTGRKLKEALEARLIDLGYLRYELAVAPDNKIAQQINLKLGFVPVARAGRDLSFAKNLSTYSPYRAEEILSYHVDAEHFPFWRRAWRKLVFKSALLYGRWFSRKFVVIEPETATFTAHETSDPSLVRANRRTLN